MQQSQQSYPAFAAQTSPFNGGGGPPAGFPGASPFGAYSAYGAPPAYTSVVESARGSAHEPPTGAAAAPPARKRGKNLAAASADYDDSDAALAGAADDSDAGEHAPASRKRPARTTEGAPRAKKPAKGSAASAGGKHAPGTKSGAAAAKHAAAPPKSGGKHAAKASLTSGSGSGHELRTGSSTASSAERSAEWRDAALSIGVPAWETVRHQLGIIEWMRRFPDHFRMFLELGNYHGPAEPAAVAAVCALQIKDVKIRTMLNRLARRGMAPADGTDPCADLNAALEEALAKSAHKYRRDAHRQRKQQAGGGSGSGAEGAHTSETVSD